jgi:hypothetical protein
MGEFAVDVVRFLDPGRLLLWSENFSRLRVFHGPAAFYALLELELVVSEFFFQPVSFERADSVFTGEGAAEFECVGKQLSCWQSDFLWHPTAGRQLPDFVVHRFLLRCCDGS